MTKGLFLAGISPTASHPSLPCRDFVVGATGNLTRFFFPKKWVAGSRGADPGFRHELRYDRSRQRHHDQSVRIRPP